MAYFDQSPFELCCEWGMGGVTQLGRSEVVIIVDVLSFTTAVDIALSRGAVILPYPAKDDGAVEYARERNAELAGPRDRTSKRHSLSPASLLDAAKGLRLVLPSPNGSNLAAAAMKSGATVLAGCLRNARAVADRARRTGGRVTVVPAGEKWQDGTLRPAAEDLVGAGAILKSLSGRLSPEAQLATAAFDGLKGDLREALLGCSSGRELVQRGFGRDVELAAELDVSTTAPALNGDEFRDCRDHSW